MRRRHAHVHDGDVRSVRAHLQEQVLRGAALADDLEAGVLEQARDPLAQEDGVVGKHDALARPEPTRLEVGVLKGIAAHLVMRAEDRREVLDSQRGLLHELVDAISARAPEVLEPMFRGDFAAAADDAGRRRVVVDQVASLTDASAVAWHRDLCRPG
jgi:dGTPase